MTACSILRGRPRLLARGLGREVTLWKAWEGPLLPLERKDYLGAVYDAIAGLEAASAVLEAALVRLDKLARGMGRPQ